MNFYEEFAKEAADAGINGFEIITIPEELRPTQKDYFELERKIEIRTRENEIMLAKSIEYAKNSMFC